MRFPIALLLCLLVLVAIGVSTRYLHIQENPITGEENLALDIPSQNNLKQLLKSNPKILSTSINPKGKIAYVKSTYLPNDNAIFDQDIFLINPDGTEDLKLVDFENEALNPINLSWSGNGNYLFWTRENFIEFIDFSNLDSVKLVAPTKTNGNLTHYQLLDSDQIGIIESDHLLEDEENHAFFDNFLFHLYSV